MAAFLEKYRHCEVEVIYLTDGTTYRDRGHLLDFDDGWIELDKGGAYGELFLIPRTAIRLIKVISPPEKVETRLLRPSAPPESELQHTRAEAQSKETRSNVRAAARSSEKQEG